MEQISYDVQYVKHIAVTIYLIAVLLNGTVEL